MLEQISPAVDFDRISISDQVYDHIKNLILSGVLQAGQRIPEKKLGDSFHVSRTPVREAIRKLAEYGLVVIKPRSYAYVATIGLEEASDITWVRLYLEKLSMRLFISVATPASFPKLYETSEKCKRACAMGDYASAHESDSLLHLSIAQATGNKELYTALYKLDAKLQLLRLKQHLSREALNFYFDQHEELLKLLAKGDLVKVETLLEKHILHDLQLSS